MNVVRWQQRAKRRAKHNSRRLSAAAVDAKRRRRQLERRWKRTDAELDRVAYHAACRAVNAEITTARKSFYNSRLLEAGGDHKATWRVAKELLHCDDRPSDPSPKEAAKLWEDFSRFFRWQIA